jgi:hypothetical protein
VTEYKEYKIEVSLTPHPWDNEKEPYFWCILGLYDNSWVNTGDCGWAKTPEEAFNKAVESFKEEI